MKIKFSQYIIPFVMSIILFSITLFGLFSAGCGIGPGTDSPPQACPDEKFPLLCPNVKVCCEKDYPFYCDGTCYMIGCPTGTKKMDVCSAD